MPVKVTPSTPAVPSADRIPSSSVQDAIDQAQAAFAGVTESQAALQRAQIDAQANAARQSRYDSCSTCAQIDVLEALPEGPTTYAPGTGFTVTGQ